MLTLFVLIIIFVQAYIRNYYKELINIRRNVPPVLRKKILLSLLTFIYDTSSKHNLHPFLQYGTLLGFHRNRDLICYDFDIDLGLFVNEFEKMAFYLNKNNTKYKIKVIDNFIKKKIVVIDKETQINADIFVYGVDMNKKIFKFMPKFYDKYIHNYTLVEYNMDVFFPLRKHNFYDNIIFIPNKPDVLLRSVYGNNYMTPDHTCNADCTKCKHIIFPN